MFSTLLPAGQIVADDAATPSLVLLLDLRVQVLLQLDAKLLAQRLELLEVLLVLLLVLDLGLDACRWWFEALANGTVRLYVDVDVCYSFSLSAKYDVPSKIRTAVGKSLTLRAALSAAVHTEGEGTRS